MVTSNGENYWNRDYMKSRLSRRWPVSSTLWIFGVRVSVEPPHGAGQHAVVIEVWKSRDRSGLQVFGVITVEMVSEVLRLGNSSQRIMTEESLRDVQRKRSPSQENELHLPPLPLCMISLLFSSCFPFQFPAGIAALLQIPRSPVWCPENL